MLRLSLSCGANRGRRNVRVDPIVLVEDEITADVRIRLGVAQCLFHKRHVCPRHTLHPRTAVASTARNNLVPVLVRVITRSIARRLWVVPREPLAIEQDPQGRAPVALTRARLTTRYHYVVFCLHWVRRPEGPESALDVITHC